MFTFLSGIIPASLPIEKLNDLNTTNYRIVETTKLFKLAVYVALAMFVRESWLSHDDSASNILDTLMLALFGFAGVNAAQYSAKRFSDKGYAAAKASGAPAQVVQTTGTVVTQTPGGPVETGGTTVAPPVVVAAPPAAPNSVIAPNLTQPLELAHMGEHNEWKDKRETIL